MIRMIRNISKGIIDTYVFGVVVTNSCLIGIKPTQKEEIHAQYCILDISIIHLSISIIQLIYP